MPTILKLFQNKLFTDTYKKSPKHILELLNNSKNLPEILKLFQNKTYVDFIVNHLEIPSSEHLEILQNIFKATDPEKVIKEAIETAYDKFLDLEDEDDVEEYFEAKGTVYDRTFDKLDSKDKGFFNVDEIDNTSPKITTKQGNTGTTLTPQSDLTPSAPSLTKIISIPQSGMVILTTNPDHIPSAPHLPMGNFIVMMNNLLIELYEKDKNNFKNKKYLLNKIQTICTEINKLQNSNQEIELLNKLFEATKNSYALRVERGVLGLLGQTSLFTPTGNTTTYQSALGAIKSAIKETLKNDEANNNTTSENKELAIQILATHRGRIGSLGGLRRTASIKEQDEQPSASSSTPLKTMNKF